MTEASCRLSLSTLMERRGASRMPVSPQCVWMLLHPPSTIATSPYECFLVLEKWTFAVTLGMEIAVSEVWMPPYEVWMPPYEVWMPPYEVWMAPCAVAVSKANAVQRARAAAAVRASRAYETRLPRGRTPFRPINWCLCSGAHGGGCDAGLVLGCRLCGRLRATA